tara:strand:+ start:4874 stop:5146 length:273 start_codon:yes stop_codon:yes gene_type:complete
MKVIVNFEVSKGFDHWKSVFDAHEADRNAWGITKVFSGVQADNPERIFVCMDVESMEKMKEFMTNPEVAAIREEAGIKMETQDMKVILDS